MADEFSERYADLLSGSYDCVDRIVLNAYMSLCHSPGGFRVWWRRWHDDGDERLDNTHLMRMAGRFARPRPHELSAAPSDCVAGNRCISTAEDLSKIFATAQSSLALRKSMQGIRCHVGAGGTPKAVAASPSA